MTPPPQRVSPASPASQRGRKIVLRSKTPDLVRQEFYGLLLGQFSTACYPLGAVRAALLAALVNTHKDFYRLGGEMGGAAFPSCAPDSSRIHT